MATTTSSIHRIGVLRAALTGAISSLVVLLLCWVGMFVPLLFSQAHADLALSTTAHNASAAAVAEGLFWSVLFGGLLGAVLATVYNLLGPLDRK
ncbi:MAG TPA: hypothetical protein VNR86_01455 [Sphingomicrobium sp.]|nr:hypothetical protein [Sphingomicrobium sp.]